MTMNMADNAKVLLGGELMFPSNYLAAVEFKGRDVTLTIAKVDREELQRRNGGKEVKPVLHFAETPKMLVLNKTNARSIARLYGTEANDWIGNRVTLYPTVVSCGGQDVEAIRVRNSVPPPKKAQNKEPQTNGELQQSDADGQSDQGRGAEIHSQSDPDSERGNGDQPAVQDQAGGDEQGNDVR